MSPLGRPEGEGRSAEHGGDPTAAPLKDAVARKGSFVQTMKAVGWSFFGVRKAADYERDVSQLNPLHVIVAGVFGAALFVAVLVVLVNWVTGSGIAGA